MPLDRVGCYVPGGRYPLPSSLLMTAIPARVAGVGEIIAVCPRPDAVGDGWRRSRPASTRLFRIGGAHAIAALAYGTATIPRVDKIVGPGNAYVAAAKALVVVDCAIDFFAGPSEIADRRRQRDAPTGSRPTCSRRPSTIPMRAPLLITPQQPAGACGRRARSTRRCRRDGPARAVARAQRRRSS